jgi:hypothetical protein
MKTPIRLSTENKFDRTKENKNIGNKASKFTFIPSINDVKYVKFEKINQQSEINENKIENNRNQNLFYRNNKNQFPGKFRRENYICQNNNNISPNYSQEAYENYYYKQENSISNECNNSFYPFSSNIEYYNQQNDYYQNIDSSYSMMMQNDSPYFCNQHISGYENNHSYNYNNNYNYNNFPYFDQFQNNNIPFTQAYPENNNLFSYSQNFETQNNQNNHIKMNLIPTETKTNIINLNDQNLTDSAIKEKTPIEKLNDFLKKNNLRTIDFSKSNKSVLEKEEIIRKSKNNLSQNLNWSNYQNFNNSENNNPIINNKLNTMDNEKKNNKNNTVSLLNSKNFPPKTNEGFNLIAINRKFNSEYFQELVDDLRSESNTNIGSKSISIIKSTVKNNMISFEPTYFFPGHLFNKEERISDCLSVSPRTEVSSNNFLTPEKTKQDELSESSIIF